MKSKLLTPLNIWGVIALVVTGIIFYWCVVRPSVIIKGCVSKGDRTNYTTKFDDGHKYHAFTTDEKWDTTSDNNFEQCLHKAGLK